MAAKEIDNSSEGDCCGIGSCEDVGAEVDYNVTGIHLIGVGGPYIGPPGEHVAALDVSVDELAVAFESCARVDSFQCEEENLVPCLHGGKNCREDRVAEQIFVILGDLPAKGGVREHAFDSFHHTINIGALLKKAKFRGEGNFSNDIESEVLQPGT